MPTIQLTKASVGLGTSISRSVVRTADGGGAREVSVPVGKAGTLTTRTDTQTGTLTLGVSHGIVTGQIIDLYWSGGERYGITVGTVAGTSVPIGADDSGIGDALPAALTAIVASPRVTIEALILVGGVKVLSGQMVYGSPTETAKSVMRFNDDASELFRVELEPNVPRIYDIVGGDANPIEGADVESVVVSQGSTTNVATFKLLWLEDSTP